MGYDIIVLAGQSNAEGTGLGDGPVFVKDERILRLYDPQDNGFEENEAGEMILKVKKPWNFLISDAEERMCDGILRASFGLWFAKSYIEHGFLKQGRKILMINAAVGGTGFTRNHWGRGDILSDRLYDMLDTALAEKDSKIVAFLWHQGEHDVFENIGMPQEQLYEKYRKSLFTLFNDVKNRYSKFSFPFIAGGFVDEYQLLEDRAGCAVVLKATESVCQELGNAAVASGEGLLSNNQVSGNGDDVHFSRQSLYILAERYFQKYLELCCIVDKV